MRVCETEIGVTITAKGSAKGEVALVNRKKPTP
jgi:hypothetical protein